MSSFLHWYIWIVAIGSIVALFWLIQATRNVESSGDEDATTGHNFDGIEEYNKPLPAWWLYLFWGTMVYGLGYYAYYGLGNWNGLADWSSVGQLADEQRAHDEEFGALFEKFATMPIETIATDAKALQLGRQIFENNCSLCHGVSAEGSNGFPNLTDSASLYGNTPDSIKTSIEMGRKGIMPAWQAILGDEKITQVTQYVLSISGQKHDAAAAALGQTVYAQSCVGCHGMDASGNSFVGAPNLTDDEWLYSRPQNALAVDIRNSIALGRAGVMPAWKDRLGDAKVQLLTGYVYSLSR
jgi:cytochrome c oxidase cbb3-type subunit 3